MNPSSPTSSTHALRRASEPVAQIAADEGRGSTTAKNPPLELKRPERQEIPVRPEWGSPDYRGSSLSVSDIGPDGLDLVASFLPQMEFKNLAMAEPAFQTAPLMRDVVESQVTIEIAELQQLEANDRIARAEFDVLGAWEHSLCAETRPALAVGAAVISAGGFFTGLGVSGGHATAIAVGGVCFGVGGLSLLGAGLYCIKRAYDRRSADQNLIAGHHALNAARHEEEVAREDILPPRIARIRSVDLPSIPLNEVSESASEGETLLPPR